ncbi:hypothetical protein TraAM80_06095 [Trypanosoma rangeli]|uniref:Uncharacterized protein n=1 Tax=Trypanosoma rangeli TaxID=5698 RepID=A0A422NBL1_TRYRA|nr:uncharacterized protein TraAM80_06095 [Trypanosoma rangeli]RNF02880.1 hypothetical protein TraAM80_06095 [Trypanosoma rangeli]|eukprot:RNF02880.1 hypothetical protein TraAM80_06095 [Trypanosoma rangeli]
MPPALQDADAAAAGGCACKHVSVMVSADGGPTEAGRDGSPVECHRQPTPAQLQRELSYLLHVLQAAHAETRWWQSRCTELQAELNNKNLQHTEIMAEVQELRVALAQERMMLLHQHSQEGAEAEGGEGGGEKDVLLTSAQETTDDVRSREVGRGFAARALLSPLPDAAVPSASPSRSRSATPLPRESCLERLAREAFFLLPPAASDTSENHDAAVATAVVPLRRDLFTSPPPVKFPRPSIETLQAAKHAVAAASAVNKRDKHAVTAVARGRHGGCTQHVRGDGDGHDAEALHLLQRLVPGVSGGGRLFSVAVGVYDGVYKLAKRWSRAEDKARRHGKRLRELETKAAAVSRLEESLQRCTRLNGLLHCRAEEKEGVIWRLRERLVVVRNEVAELKRRLAEPQRHDKPNEAEETEEGEATEATGMQQVGPARERNRPSLRPSRDTDDAHPCCRLCCCCSGVSRASRIFGVKASRGAVTTCRSDDANEKDGDALQRERAHADAAAAELACVRKELQRARRELRQGKHLLARLVREGRSELRKHHLTEEAEEASTAVVRRRQTHRARDTSAVESPEPRPPGVLLPASSSVAYHSGDAQRHDPSHRAGSASFLVSTLRGSPSREGVETVTPTMLGQRDEQTLWHEEYEEWQLPLKEATPRTKGWSSWAMELADDSSVAPWGDWSNSPP